MNSKAKVLITVLAVVLLLILAFFRTDLSPEELLEKYNVDGMSVIQIEGMPVHYVLEGRGPALLLLHGTSSSLHTWDGWVETLSDSFRIIRVDLPGFGLTGPHPEADYSIDMFTRVLGVLMDSLQIDAYSVAGNSLGGYIAWNMAVAYPDAVEKVVLLDAVAYHQELDAEGLAVKSRGHSLAFKLARNPFAAFMVRWITPRFLVKSSLQEVYYDDSKVSESLVDRYYHLLRRKGNRKAFIDNVQSRVPEGKEQHLPGLTAPVLIQWGMHDEWIDVSLAYWFEKVLPDNELIIYDKAGHVPMEEIPEQTGVDAKRFLLKARAAAEFITEE